MPAALGLQGIQFGQGALLRPSTLAPVSTTTRRTAATRAIRDSSGNIVCDPTFFAALTRDNIAGGVAPPQAGCVPYNPMGRGVSSAATIDYISDTGWSNMTIRQYQAGVNLSGEPFFTFPGVLCVAAGSRSPPMISAWQARRKVLRERSCEEEVRSRADSLGRSM